MAGSDIGILQNRPTEATAPWSQDDLSYFSTHGIEPDVASRCAVTSTRGALRFDHGSFYRYRLHGGGRQKCSQPRGQKLSLWWVEHPPEYLPTVLLTEGEGDALSARSALSQSTETVLPSFAVASLPGTQMPLDRVVAEMVRIEASVVYTAFDGDSPGRSSTEKLAELLQQAGIGVRILPIPDGHDLAEVLAGQPRETRGETLASMLAAAEESFSEEKPSHLSDDLAQALKSAPADPPRTELLRSGWAPLDLTSALKGRGRVEQPAILRRTDGEALIYPGRLHLLFGPPEAGKGWLTLWAMAEVVRGGGVAVLVDFEVDEIEFVGRMLALGLSHEEIVRGCLYIKPDVPLGEAGWSELEETILAKSAELIVLDAVTEAMLLEQLDPLLTPDVARWFKRLPRRLCELSGAAVIVIDHVTKEKEGRGRFPFGAQHKLAGVDVAYGLTVCKPFARGGSGRVDFKVRKDRPGHVRALSADDRIGVMNLNSSVDDGVFIRIEPPERTTDPGKATQIEPEEVMERLSMLIEANPGINKSALRKELKGQHKIKDLAIKLLVLEEFVRVEPGHSPQEQRHYSNKPYRVGR